MMVVGGIDAGGTATKCLLLDGAGNTLFAHQGQPANYQGGPDEAAKAIKATLSAAMAGAGIDRVELLGIGLAGAGRKHELERMKACLGTLEGVNRYALTDDGEIAVLGAHRGQPGVVLIAGTGSIAYGLRQDGTMIRNGGWGAILGDEGSGYWIGLKAVQAVIRAEEGRGQQTVLSTAVCRGLGIDSLTALPALVYNSSLGRKEIAALVPTVVQTAADGDLVAAAIIDAAVHELALLVEMVQKLMDFPRAKVAVSGGLFANPLFMAAFTERLAEASGSTPVKPSHPPVVGAVIYGARQSGWPLPFLELKQ